MYLLQHTALLEAREDFMCQLKDDKRLFKIIEDKDIDIDDVF